MQVYIEVLHSQIDEPHPPAQHRLEPCHTLFIFIPNFFIYLYLNLILIFFGVVSLINQVIVCGNFRSVEIPSFFHFCFLNILNSKVKFIG